MAKEVKLIFVSADNNNKFYHMKEVGGIIQVEYGRVEKTCVKETYPLSMWDKKYREKLKKGYKDVTHLYTEDTTTTSNPANPQATLSAITNKEVKTLFDTLQAYANKSIQQNYTVTAEKVTEKQVEEAQAALDALTKKLKVGAKKADLDKELLELYMIVPRQMANVKNHLFPGDIKTQADLDKAQKIAADEQATLDVMAGQVAQLKATKNATSATAKDVKKTITVLEAMGLEIEEVTDAKVIDLIKDKMNDLKRNGQQDNSKIFKRAFKVVNKKTQAAFDKHLASAPNKQCELFWHGSRNANYLSILEKGLLIRPAGAGYNGSAFGDGIYFAQHSGKSLNYSDYAGSYRSYTGGRSSQAFLLLFNVNVGKQKVVSSSGNYNLKDLTKEGYDSTWAKATKSSYIAYDEYIIYRSEQCTIQYLIEVQ